MSYYPVFIDLQRKSILVVGGGAVAQRKIQTLLEYGAFPHVVARQLTPLLADLVKQGKVTFLGTEFSKSHFEDVFMVITATDDAHLNQKVSTLAQEKGLLVNAVDQPSDCNFILPSVLRRGDLTIAVSTSGKSPALAKKVRHELEKIFGTAYGDLLILMGHFRKEILRRGLPQRENKLIFEKLVDSDLLQKIEEKNWQKVAETSSRLLDKAISEDDIIHLLKEG